MSEPVECPACLAELFPEEWQHVPHNVAHTETECPVCEAIIDAERVMAQVRDEYPEFTIEGWVQ